MDKDQKYFDQVAQELNNGNIDPGVWARALADTSDESAKAKARYINLRVNILKKLEQEHVAKTRAQARQAYSHSRPSPKEPAAEGSSEAKVLLLLVGFTVLIGLVSVSGL